MTTQIARKGSTVTIEIPEELLREARLSVGDSVEWRLTPAGTLILHGHVMDSKQVEDDYEKWKLGEIEAGLVEFEAGESIPGDVVNEWLRSWGTEKELPPPR